MDNKNSLTKKVSAKFSDYLESELVKTRLIKVLSNPKDTQRFKTAVVSLVSSNPALEECSHASVLAAAIAGESLKLSPAVQLGQYYIVPFNNSKTGKKVATFQMGYKGYLQLAIRSNLYRRLIVLPVKQGELKRFDYFTEEAEFKMIEDERTREKTEAMGYYGMFELTDGFRKAMYWSKPKMEYHAQTYSRGYSSKKGYTFWEKDFDQMGVKTLVKQLLSKWGPLTIDLEEAITKDETIINEDGQIEYFDNDSYFETASCIPEGKEIEFGEKEFFEKGEGK